MNNKEEIGIIIAKARNEKKITQNELAKKLNVTNKAISNWENGRNLPDRDIIKELEKVLDINIEEIQEKPIYKRKNNVLICFIVILSFLFFPLFLYFVNNYDKSHVYIINIDSDKYFIDNSYIIINNDSIIMDIKQINIVGMPYNYDYKVSLLYDNKEILFKYHYDGIYIEEKGNYKLLNKDMLKKIDKFSLLIEYYDLENNFISDYVNLLFEKEYSNDKIFGYGKEIEEDENLELINLLENNNYNRIDSKVYEKNKDNILYRYNLKDNNLTINYCKKDYCAYVSVLSLVDYTYVIVSDNRVIEYKLEDTSNNKLKYMQEIYDIAYGEYKKSK